MKYKVGDRVIGIAKNSSKKDIRNLKGTIIVCNDDEDVCVEFDEHIGGHDCLGEGKKGHCWWVNGLTHIKKCSGTAKIVITTDGTETLARLYEDGKVVKSATAKCSPKDEFDFSIGAKLAFDRLTESPTEKKEKYYNGKVVCISKRLIGLTCGKIYEFRDGRVIDDDGDLRPASGTLPIKELDDSWVRGCFIPLVEEKKG